VRRWAEAFPGTEVLYYWDGPPMRLLSHRLGGTPAQAPPLIQKIDRNLLWPLWQRMNRSPDEPRLWHWGAKPLPVDVLHHTAGLLLPIEGHANVMTIHDLIPYHSPDYCQGATDMFGDGFRLADRMDLLITVSEYTKQDVVNSLGVDANKVRAIPHATHEQFRYIEDRDAVRAVLAKYDMDRRPYIIHLGNMEARKNIPRLLEAFKRVKTDPLAPATDHELVLVGEGAAFEEMKARIEQLELGADARCLGFAPFEDLPALLNGADLFMYPSMYEGFGLPAIEAMACGCPIAAANVTSLPEVVGDAGMLFDPLDVGAMEAVLGRILGDANLREQMRQQGLARAREFSWERTARRHLEVYEEAWDRFQRNGRHPQSKTIRTRYRQVMHDWTMARSSDYAREGARVNTWPF
jgi:glycosyltransferase involved in cell wall biosynthesis